MQQFSTANGMKRGTPVDFTGTGTAQALFPLPQMVRTRSLVGGTSPSFTYSVEGVCQ